MRGNVNSPFVNSQTPYTIRYINGAPVDVHKKQILNITGKIKIEHLIYMYQ
ncbi:Uncharacterised protein [Myroides odoratus]|nr:hypothetical protein Myrod_2805 [Myroides odoratus DSM 2801]EKB04380.1 hypothetical protein HMPREF9716_03292 [Myroides odoratus CIP 103059]STZ30902.1 Uncharacterised protein [Myroides odoratus]